MIQVTAQSRIRVAVEPTDFRKGIDGLARVCREQLGGDPFSGTVFVFTNRLHTAIKALAYDGRAFWLCQMRLSSGRLRHWPTGTCATCALCATELLVLLRGGDPKTAKGAPLWRPLPAHG